MTHGGNGPCDKLLSFGRRKGTRGSRVIDDRGGGVNVREVGKDGWGAFVGAAV